MNKIHKTLIVNNKWLRRNSELFGLKDNKKEEPKKEEKATKKQGAKKAEKTEKTGSFRQSLLR